MKKRITHVVAGGSSVGGPLAAQPEASASRSDIDQEELSRPERLLRDLRVLEGRDLRMWSIGLLVLLVVASGFLALVFPNLMWGLGTMRVNSRYLPQLFFGFFALIILYNIYAFEQRRALRNAREELVRQLIRREAAEQLSVLDPLTDTFNRRYLDQIFAKEVSRAERQGTGLALVMIDLDDFKSVNTRFGHLVGDRILVEVAQMMKRTFRKPDTVVRYGGDEFLAVLTDTDEQDAHRAVGRLREEVEGWNRSNPVPGYTMWLSYGVAAYAKGASIRELIQAADRNLYRCKADQAPTHRAQF